MIKLMHMKKLDKKTEFLRAVKYILITISAGIVQIVSFAIFTEILKMTYWPSYLIALILSVVWNFTINRKYTFRTVANIHLAMLEVFGYYVIFTPLSTWWGDALVNIGWNNFVVLGFTMLINFLTEYLFYFFVVYRNKIDNALKQREEKNKQNDTTSRSV